MINYVRCDAHLIKSVEGRSIFRSRLSVAIADSTARIVLRRPTKMGLTSRGNNTRSRRGITGCTAPAEVKGTLAADTKVSVQLSVGWLARILAANSFQS